MHVPHQDGIWINARIAAQGDPDRTLEQAALVVRNGMVAWLGPMILLPAEYADLPRHDVGNRWITPGLIDCHTHLVYGGNRADEFALRLAGASYEEIARRGRDTLRFGPMKPTGLTDPRTGRWPYAAVQLRQENLRADSYNLVGFQNHLRFGEQKRIMRLIPGLENAEFLRYGQIHRNTYINAPSLLDATLQLRKHPNVFFAGQISGVEGYVESIATGLVAGMLAAAHAAGEAVRELPRETAIGSLCHYISHADPKHYQPANIAFDLFPALTPNPRDRKERQTAVCARALEQLDLYLSMTEAHV